jgi:hypothetical protein
MSLLAEPRAAAGWTGGAGIRLPSQGFAAMESTMNTRSIENLWWWAC